MQSSKDFEYANELPILLRFQLRGFTYYVLKLVPKVSWKFWAKVDQLPSFYKETQLREVKWPS